MDEAVRRLRGRAMASSVEVVVVDGPHQAERWAAARIDQLEQRWSRFLPHSEITRLNAAAGATVSVHPDTSCLLSAMLQGWHLGGARFDPREAGDGTGAPSAIRPLDGDLTLDQLEGTACLAPGVTLDPGAIGKGLAADLVVQELRRMGCRGALVGIGGDLSASGAPPEGERWRVEVEPVLGDVDEPPLWLDIEGGGVATSSVLHRHGELAGLPRQDHRAPRARVPVGPADLLSATVVARSGWLAEVHATAALLAGESGAVRHLRAHGLTGVLQTSEQVRVVELDSSGSRSC